MLRRRHHWWRVQTVVTGIQYDGHDTRGYASAVPENSSCFSSDFSVMAAGASLLANGNRARRRPGSPLRASGAGLCPERDFQDAAEHRPILDDRLTTSRELCQRASRGGDDSSHSNGLQISNTLKERPLVDPPSRHQGIYGCGLGGKSPRGRSRRQPGSPNRSVGVTRVGPALLILPRASRRSGHE